MLSGVPLCATTLSPPTPTMPPLVSRTSCENLKPPVPPRPSPDTILPRYIIKIFNCTLFLYQLNKIIYIYWFLLYGCTHEFHLILKQCS